MAGLSQRYQLRKLVKILQKLDQDQQALLLIDRAERDLVPLDEHVERLTASRNLLAARLREVEDEDVEGHCWPGAC